MRSARDNPFAEYPLFVADNTAVRREQVRLQAAGQYQAAATLGTISNQPQAIWLGDWPEDIEAEVARVQVAAHGQLPVFVLYNIPGRDNGQHSAGGAVDQVAYQIWIERCARAIGQTPAVVILEPDALADLDACPRPVAELRRTMIAEARQQLTEAGCTVYIDAGHTAWHPAAVMAERLSAVGVTHAAGFSLNVAHYNLTIDETRYAHAINALLGQETHCVIDTSRNGQGPAPENDWCNPSARGLGAPPTTKTGSPLVDAWLWIKAPGESDGVINDSPAAGTFWLDGALRLIQYGADEHQAARLDRDLDKLITPVFG